MIPTQPTPFTNAGTGQVLTRKFTTRLRRTLAIIATASATAMTYSATLPQLAYAADANKTPPTASDFGRLPALSGLVLSPDGLHLAALTSSDGKTQRISVWDTTDLAKPPVIIGSDPRVRFMGVSFVKNNRMLVRTRQLLDYGAEHTFLFKLVFTDLTGSTWFSGVPDQVAKTEGDDLMRLLKSPQIVSRLPNDPDSVLVAGDDGAVYKSNLKTGKISLQERVSDKDGDLLYDANGQLVAKTQFDFENGKAYFIQLIKNPDTSVWEEHFRAYAKDREIPSIVALTKDPRIILVAARRGKDHTAIYNYDIKSKTFGDVAFEHPMFDAENVLSNPKNNDIIGFGYEADRGMVYYADDKMAATIDSISAALGVKTEKIDWQDLATGKKVRFEISDGDNIALVSYSEDYSHLIFRKSGPANPGDYYMYIEGKGLQPLGSARPWLDKALLADGHLVQYTARDGRPVPALVFKPKSEQYGAGPYPTLLIPHGGPWARDDLSWSADSSWVQYFVARGYAVAMPEYRGSQGWGWAQWTAGDNRWGEEMSDDMDDVALGMVKAGIADKNRLAMHGYSFGGYSTMAAIVRPNPIYQCSISGAGPSSPQSMQRETQDSRFTREFQRPYVGGMNALANVDKASIPILIYHGDRDHNVRPEESKEFYDALVSHHKTARREVFKDMGHEADKWNPENEIHLLTMIDDYLKTECKTGGL